jgi:hypothetical protein
MNQTEILEKAIPKAVRLFKIADKHKHPGIVTVRATIKGTRPETAINYTSFTDSAAAYTALEKLGISNEDPNFPSLLAIVASGVRRAVADYAEITAERSARAHELNMAALNRTVDVD